MKGTYILSYLLILLPLKCLLAQSFVISEKNPMPMKVSNNAVTGAFVNGDAYVYSFAGIDSTKDHNGIGLWAFRYNIQTDVWDSIAPLPDSIGKIAASANRVKNLIYIIGGYHVFDNGSELSSNKVHIYDPQSNSYLADGAAIPVPIDDQVQAVWRDSLIYVITGWSQFRNVVDVQIYNPALNIWTSGSPVPNFGSYKSFGSSGTIVGDTIFYFGGASSNGLQNFPIQNSLRMGIIDANDPSLIHWRDTILDPGLKGYRMACTQIKGNIHWIGGSNRTYNYDGLAYSNGQGVEPLNRNLFLEPESLKWASDSSSSQAFPMDLRGIAEVSSNTRYIVGGMNSNQKVSNKTLKLEFVKNDFSLEINSSHELNIFPNPFHDFVWISAMDNDYRELILFNSLGQKVLEVSFRNKLRLDFSNFNDGIYFLKDGNGDFSIKLIKN